MTDKISIAFLGGGVSSAVGHVHEIACRMDNRYDLVAGCFSRDPDTNKKTAAVYAVDPERTYDTYADLLRVEKGRTQVIAILTPPDQHTAQIIDALRAGYAVICEKPLCTTSDEAAAIRAALDETKGFLGITYNYLAYPMVRELAAVIAEGRLGKIHQVMAEMPQEGFLRLRADTNAPMVPQAWRRQDGSVSTVSLDLCAHLHMLVRFLTNERPLEVSAMANTFGNFDTITDSVTAIARYTNDLAVNLWFTKTALGQRNGLKIRVFGHEGAAEWVQETPETLLMSDRHGRRYTLDRGHPDARVASQDRYTRFKVGHPAGFIEAFANCYYDLADAIQAFKRKGRHENPYVSGIDSAGEGMHLLEAVALSAHDRKWVSLKA